jgi:uncharacterized membrane protein YqjE
MGPDNNHPPRFTTLAQKIGRTGLGLLHNRGELLMVELQEEKGRAILLLVGAITLSFLGIMSVMLVTGTIIFLVPEELRLYVAGVFALLYAGGAVFAYFSIKNLLKRTPFGQTLSELKKDRVWFESLE